MSATLSSHERRASFEDTDNELQGLGEGLRERGWAVRLSRHRTCGELDVRLEVGGAGGSAVELLGLWAEALCADRWQAVRVTPDSRIVWCGPARSCSRAELIGFVEALLAGDPDEVARRFARLG